MLNDGWTEEAMYRMLRDDYEGTALMRNNQCARCGKIGWLVANTFLLPQGYSDADLIITMFDEPERDARVARVRTGRVAASPPSDEGELDVVRRWHESTFWGETIVAFREAHHHSLGRRESQQRAWEECVKRHKSESSDDAEEQAHAGAQPDLLDLDSLFDRE